MKPFFLVLERCLMCTSSMTNLGCIDPVPEEFLHVCHMPMNSSCFTRIVGNVYESLKL